MVELELTYLNEIGRVTSPAADVLDDLGERIGLTVSSVPFATVTQAATALSWTRDPFDRMIVANAACDHESLLTKDARILKNIDSAIW